MQFPFLGSTREECDDVEKLRLFGTQITGSGSWDVKVRSGNPESVNENFDEWKYLLNEDTVLGPFLVRDLPQLSHHELFQEVKSPGHFVFVADHNLTN